jgi:hypothetical protein
MNGGDEVEVEILICVYERKIEKKRGGGGYMGYAEKKGNV